MKEGCLGHDGKSEAMETGGSRDGGVFFGDDPNQSRQGHRRNTSGVVFKALQGRDAAAGDKVEKE